MAGCRAEWKSLLGLELELGLGLGLGPSRTSPFLRSLAGRTEGQGMVSRWYLILTRAYTAVQSSQTTA